MNELDGDRIMLLSILNVSSSIGYLELNSNNPFDQPRIHLNFFEKSGDLYKIISSLKLYHEIFKQPPLNTIYNVKEIGINNNTNGDNISDEDWKKLVLEKVHIFYITNTIWNTFYIMINRYHFYHFIITILFIFSLLQLFIQVKQ